MAKTIAFFALAFVLLIAALVVRVPPPRSQAEAAVAEATPVSTQVFAIPAVDVETNENNANAAWTDLDYSTNCWFFSGPAPLGRDASHGTDAHIERSGEAISVSFGAATFKGSISPSGSVVLFRDGGGWNDGWLYFETLAGGIKDGALDLGYTYRECALQSGGSCPNPSAGNCRISARVRIADR